MKNSLRSKNLPLFAQVDTAPLGNPKTKTTSSLKGFLTLVVMVLGMGVSWGQTYYQMSSGNYSQTFTGLSTSYPTNMNGVAIISNGTIPIATTTTTATNSTLAVPSSSTALGYDAISANSTKMIFICSGATDNSAAVACDLNLDFTGRSVGNLAFNYALIANTFVTSGRASSLQVYYSINGTSWTALGGPYTVYNTTGASTANVPVNISLPSALNGQATVKLRFYEYNGGTVVGTPSGSRPKISLDDITVSSTAAGSTVTFNASSGSITTTTQTAATATNLTSASTLGLSRTGYSFGGWATSAANATAGTVAYANNASYDFSSSITLYAIWTANNNTITFNANTGSGTAMTNQTIATAASANLTSNTYTKAGYTFAGWNTLADGTGTSYLDGASYTMGTANVTLYAKWTANNNTITFDANTGTGTAMANQTIATAASANLTSNTYTKAGYTFAGWNTLADGTGTSYANSASYTMGTANVTLYAKWTANTLVVTYNSQSGSAIANGSTTTGGSIATSPGTPTRSGYTFNGWFAASAGGTAIAFPYTHGQTSDFTLYAQWTINTYTITYNGNGSDGGSAPVDGSSPYNYNSSVTVLGAGTLTYTGNTFAGWNTVADGSGTSYSTGASITSFAANTILYAQWTSNSAPACPFSTAVLPTSTQTLCQGVTSTSLSAAITNAGISGTPTYQYQWYYNTTNSNTVSGAFAISGETNSTFTPLTSASEVGTRYYFCVGYASDNSCTSSSTTQSLASSVVRVTVVATPNAPSGSASQAFCGSATIASLTATGTAVQWYDAATGGNLLASSTSIVDGSHYYASQTINGCESTSRLDVTATINSIPNAPTGSASQSFCGSATIASLVATGTTVQWYAAATGGSALSSATALVSGTHYYASQTVSGCFSGSRLDVTVTINSVPSAPSGTASQSFCVSGTVANLTATGTAIQWFSASSGGSVFASTDALVSGTHYYASQTVTGCESASRLDVTATINSLPNAPTGNAPQSFCGSATVANLIATGSTIQWYDAASGGNLIGSPTALVDGTHYYASQTVNGCESSARLDVTAAIVSIPATPTASNNGPACLNEALTLSTPTVSGATYAWTGPNGFTSSTQNPTVSAIATAAMAGTYSVTVTVSGCTSAAVTTAVTVNSALVVGSVTGIATPIYGNNLVISQVYGGGAAYRYDFVELFNPTNATVNLNGYSIQYQTQGASTWTNVASLTGSIASGKYYLIHLADGGSEGTVATITADLTASQNLSATQGKMALVNSITALTTCTSANIIDKVAYGTTSVTCNETSNAPAPSATKSITRVNGGCTDTNNNSVDFTLLTPSPRNSSSAANTCTTNSYAETICTGATPTSASVSDASGSSGAYTYQWYSYNGITTPTATPAISSWTAVNTGQDLTTSALTQSKTYACYITPNGCGLGAWANGYRQVAIVVSPGVIASGQTICSGNTPAAFTSTIAASSSGTITYQWESSTVSDFASSVTTIASTNSATYTPGSLSATTYYRRKATSTVNSVTCSAYSNIITISVNPMPSITLGLIDDVALLATSFSIPYSATSGVDTFSVSAANTNVMLGFSAVVNASLVSTPIVVTIPTQNTAGVTYDFYMTVKNGTTGCVSSPYTFDIMVTGINHGAIGTDQTICSGTTPNTLTNVTAASGSGAVTYSWEQATAAINGPYTAISGATGTTYAPGALTQTTYYKRVASNGLETSDSDPITITVNPNPTALVLTGSTNCSGSLGTITSSASVSGVNYQLYNASNVAIGSVVAGTDSGLSWSSIAIATGYYVKATNATTTCVSANSNAVAVGTITDKTWIGTTNNSWNTPSNWSCNSVPSTSDTIVISSGNPQLDTDFTVAGSLTISGTGTLTINSNNTLTISAPVNFGGKSVTIKSDANGTGAIGQVSGPLTNATNVTVERYIPAKRSWRALTSPVIASGSIYANWQEGGIGNTVNGFDIWSPNATDASVTTGGVSNSLMEYNSTSNTWSGITNTASTSSSSMLTADGKNKPFMAFPTGPFGTGNITTGQTATTIRATGTLLTGPQNYACLGTKYTLIGNPYASTLSIIDLLISINPAFEGNLWVWDPNGIGTNGVGAYNLFDAAAFGYANTTSGTFSNSTTTAIQSGQAFFVKPTSDQTFTIQEIFKNSDTNNAVFGKQSNTQAEVIRVGIFKQINNVWTGRDGAMEVIFPEASATQTANKLSNGTENIAFTKNGNFFASEHHLPLVSTDTLNVRIWKTTAGANYKLKINTEQFTTTGLDATLQDLYTNTNTPLSLDGTAVEYPFTVTSDATSSGDRFRIVFSPTLGTHNFTNSSIKISPNPIIGDSFQVSLGSLSAGNYDYFITNSIGQEIGKGTITHNEQAGYNTVKMRENVAAGIYIVKIIGADKSVHTTKLIKQ